MSRYGPNRREDEPATIAMRERVKGRTVTHVVPVSEAVLRQRRAINRRAAE